MDKIQDKSSKTTKAFIKRNLANALSASRIILGLSLFLCLNNKAAYLTIYAVAWITDIFDGKIARLTNSQSQLGTTLDDIGDMALVSILMVSIFFWLEDTTFLIVLLSIFFAIRIVNALITRFKYGKFCFSHTHAAKFLGVFVFFIPVVYFFAPLNAAIAMIWVVMCASYLISIEETLIHIFSKEFNLKIRSVFLVKKFNADYDRLKASEAETQENSEKNLPPPRVI